MSLLEPQLQQSREAARSSSVRVAPTTTPWILDFLLAAAAFVLLSPALAVVAILVRLDSPGPAFFLQDRTGYRGRKFKIIKFRTMSVLENGGSIAQAKRQDCRVTRLGYWLRHTSIDELPQLINVLKGDMSIVGPRPHAVCHDEAFARVIDNYKLRQRVKPGLTGWAQVNGLRGETPDVASMAERVSYDLWYIENRSLLLDTRIILKTARIVFTQENAY